MSYLYKGTEIQLNQPLRSVSVHKNKVIFSDLVGFKNVTLDNAKDTKSFINWLCKK